MKHFVWQIVVWLLVAVLIVPVALLKEIRSLICFGIFLCVREWHANDLYKRHGWEARKLYRDRTRLSYSEFRG
jgi:hypothetical protein